MMLTNYRMREHDRKLIDGLYDLGAYVLGRIGKEVEDGYHTAMVEIGCYRGESTRIWSTMFNEVYAIDPWEYETAYMLREFNHVCKQQPLEKIKEELDWENIGTIATGVEDSFDEVTKTRKNIFKMKGTSMELCNTFEEEELDFVYIDGDHSYEAVVDDIMGWLPKLKPNRFIAGHDYTGNYPQIKEAVNTILQKPDAVFQDGSWVCMI